MLMFQSCTQNLVEIQIFRNQILGYFILKTEN